MTAESAAKLPNLAPAMHAMDSGIIMRKCDDRLNATFVSPEGIPANIMEALISKPYVYAYRDPATGSLMEVSKKQYERARCENSVFIHRSILKCIETGMPLVLGMNRKTVTNSSHYVLAADYMSVSELPAAVLNSTKVDASNAANPAASQIGHAEGTRPYPAALRT